MAIDRPASVAYLHAMPIGLTPDGDRMSHSSTNSPRSYLEEQRAEPERLRTTLASIADAVITTDPEGRVTSLNAAAEKLTGWGAAEATGHPLGEVFRLVEGATDESAVLASFVRGGEAVLSVDRKVLVARDQAARWIEHNDAPIKDERGVVSGTVIVFRDITDRMEMEAALREQAERLQLALDSGRMGTWEWDVRTNRVAWSDNLEKIHGLPRGGFDGTFEGFQRLIHPEDRGRVERAINDSIAQGSVYEVEFRNVWPDGSIHWMSGRGMTFTDECGQPIRMTGTAMDITERKQIETSLREADRRKEEFLAVLSHELRNPLAPIQTSLYLMGQAGMTGAEFERERAIVERQVQHLTRLVDDLLDVSRISRGQIELQTKVVVLSEAIAEVVEAVKFRIDERSQQLDISLPEESIRLEADQTRLEQILLNLLTNAAKYTDNGGRIGLTAERDEDQVVVRVRDTGIGISAEMLPRIFDLFVQGERRLDQAQGGHGDRAEPGQRTSWRSTAGASLPTAKVRGWEASSSSGCPRALGAQSRRIRLAAVGPVECTRDCPSSPHPGRR